jgi:hypothetical protein
MKKSVYQELLAHSIESLQEILSYDANFDLDDLHNVLFNADYYIIGYWDASQWLKKHAYDPFGAIADVIEFEQNTIGEINLKAGDINSEKIVNLLAYFLGYELLSEFDTSASGADLLEEMKIIYKGL